MPASPSSAALLLGLLALAFVFFVFGVVTPMITIHQLLVIENTFSVLSGVLQLLRNGHYLLFVIVTGFSLVLPILKMGVILRLLVVKRRHPERLKRLLRLMHDYGRWAMLDVLVVAVLVVTVKLGAIASIEIHYGLYLFGASVLLVMYLTHRVVKLFG